MCLNVLVYSVSMILSFTGPVNYQWVMLYSSFLNLYLKGKVPSYFNDIQYVIIPRQIDFSN